VSKISANGTRKQTQYWRYKLPYSPSK
jgi:hypothetical protein